MDDRVKETGEIVQLIKGETPNDPNSFFAYAYTIIDFATKVDTVNSKVSPFFTIIGDLAGTKGYSLVELIPIVKLLQHF